MSDITTGTELDGSLGTITRTNGDISAGVAMSGAITPPPTISGEVTTSLSLSGELTSQLSSDGSVAIGNEVEGQIVGGPKGDTGPTGPQGDPGVVQAIVAGSGISVDNTDPANPIVTNTKAWGNITGTLSNQTDLQNALDDKVDTVPGKGLSENDYTTTEKNKLSGIASGAEVNVNADWSSGSGDSQILNKPTLATVATSGDYNDLSNKPSIPASQVNSDWNSVSGVSKILNKPTIPTKTSDLTNDSSFITSAGAPVQSVNSKTGTVSLNTSDVPDSTNKRYITDAQQVVLGNTSNTNTGDQDLSGLVPKTTTVNSKALSSNITLNIDDVAPAQTGNAGKVLKTDGTNATWQSDAGGIASVVAGNNIDVDNTDPDNPVVAVENLTLTDITDITATATEVNYIDGVTSAVQTQLNAKANDTDVVKLTGNQTISGDKTFTTNVSINGTSYLSTTNVYGDLTMKTGTHLVLDSDPTTAMQAVTKQYADALGGITFTSDTKANILATTPTAGTYAISTDTDELFFYDGTNWQVESLPVSEAGLDAGAQQSDANGYYSDLISEKLLYHVVLKWSDVEVAGSLRVNESTDPPVLQIYLRDKWNTIDYGLSMNSAPELAHTPYQREIDVRSGNSNDLSLSGLPVVQEYQSSLGAYQPPAIIRGGEL